MTLYWGRSALCGLWRFVQLTSLQQSEPPVWPLLWREVKGHRGSSESGILSPWGTGAGRLGTSWGESSGPYGILLHTHCPANAAKCLKRRESTNPLLTVSKATVCHKYRLGVWIWIWKEWSLKSQHKTQNRKQSTWRKINNYCRLRMLFGVLKHIEQAPTDLKQGPCPLFENRNNTC